MPEAYFIQLAKEMSKWEKCLISVSDSYMFIIGDWAINISVWEGSKSVIDSPGVYKSTEKWVMQLNEKNSLSNGLFCQMCLVG